VINKKSSFSLPSAPWLSKNLQTQGFKKPYARLGLFTSFTAFEKTLKKWKAPEWRKAEDFTQKEAASLTFDTPLGPVGLIYVPESFDDFNQGWPELNQPSSAWGVGRNKAGEVLKYLESFGLESLEVSVSTPSEDFFQGVVCGLEMSSYSFKGRKHAFKKMRILKGEKALRFSELGEAPAVAWGVNCARHLVNLPPNELTPEKYADLLGAFFKKKTGVQVEIWNEKKLAQENCGLHLAVGQGSDSPPRLVILKYRPTKAPKNQKPIALVGKGITFDTGGLDIKPSSGMRLMKKDMGGSAAMVGTFLAAVENKMPIKLNAYLALAENSVSAAAFRPSDLVRARNGKVIEIHNTDAEGRLVLADALDVAVTEKETPQVVVNAATLTGAIKVGLGSQVAGLFSNRGSLAKELFSACGVCGEDVWPMPLYQKYRAQMHSPFADMVNAVDGFGGAITAALFLESFVNDVPWAHLDIYAWKDAPEGAVLEPGGSGQAVQGLVRWLKSRLDV